jgi:hypothetical protein
MNRRILNVCLLFVALLVFGASILAPGAQAQYVAATLGAQQHGGGTVTLGPIIYDYVTEGTVNCAATCTFATPASTQVGDTLIACYISYTATGRTLSSISGDGSWVNVVSALDSTTVDSISCMHNLSASSAGATTLTFTLSATDAASYLEIFRYKGGGTAGYFGSAVTNTGTSTASPQTPSIAPNGSANLVFTATVPDHIFIQGSNSSGTGFTSPLMFADNAFSGGAFEDARSVASGTYQATLTQTNAAGASTAGTFSSVALAFTGFSQVVGGCEDSTLMNGSGGTNGNTITTGTLASSTHGLNVQGTWSMSGTAPTWSTVSTLGPKNAYTICGGGASETANSSTLAVTITGTGSAFASNAAYAFCPLSSGQGDALCGYTNMYMLCWVNDNFVATDTSDIDTCGLTAFSSGTDDFILANWYGNGTNRFVQLESTEGNSGSTISVNSGTSVCPCALLMHYVAGNGSTGGTSTLTVYNASGTSLGTLTVTTAATKYSITQASIGNSRAAATITSGKVFTETSVKLMNGTAPTI